MLTLIQSHPFYFILILSAIIGMVSFVYLVHTASSMAFDWDEDGLYQTVDSMAESAYNEESGTFLPFFIPSDETLDNWKDSQTQKTMPPKQYIERDKPVNGLPEFIALSRKSEYLWQTLWAFHVIYKEKISEEDNKAITNCLNNSHPFKK